MIESTVKTQTHYVLNLVRENVLESRCVKENINTLPSKGGFKIKQRTQAWLEWVDGSG